MICRPRPLRSSIFIFIIICLGFVVTASGAGAQEPLIIGEHLTDVVLETPHPYPVANGADAGPVWSDQFSYPGAEYLVFEFTRFELAPGDWVEIRDPDRKQVHVYKGRGFKGKGGDFISKMILGPEAIIELYSENADHDYYGYFIKRVTRGYSASEMDALYGGGGQTDAICGTDDKEDALCYEGSFPDVYEEARAVARIVMDGSALCTAWLVSCNNHVMTNNHCTWDDSDFDTQGELDRMEFQFMYEDAVCGGSGATFEYSFMGGTWLENDHNLDYTLIQAPVTEDPASTYGWLLIDDRLVDIDETIYVVGHPGGRPKEISLYSTHPTDQDNPDGFCEVFSQDEPVCVGGTVGEIGYYCDTEGGSSGSPVLSRVTNKVVALHHCANCPNRGVRIEDIWATNQAGPNALPVCSLFDDAGSVKLDSGLYNCSGTLSVEVSDGSLPGAGSQDVTLWSDTESAPETLTLIETGPDSGDFTGTLSLGTTAAVNGDGVLSVAHGDDITVQYIDADDGQGGVNVIREANATVDCAPPTISNVQVGSVTGQSAIVTWDTDEAADSEVSYATSPPAWSIAGATDLVTGHQVDLMGLSECSVYVFSVRSGDGAANSVEDDNGGAYYSFSTGVNNQPEYPSTDTPIAIVDNTTFNSVITVTDSETVLDVDVRLNITHTYDGDLDIFLVGPDSTRVELTSDNGGSGENFVDTIFDDEATTAITGGASPFTGRFQPEGSLATLDGLDSAGTWTLEVTDDAGADQGELVSWDLILTYEAQACGAVGEFVSHQLQTDACSTGSAGLGNGLWEVGEQVQFSVTVKNTGTDPLSGVITQVTPITAGIVMLDDTATVGNVAPGQSTNTLQPHVIAQLTDTLQCGEMMDFQVDITSNEGSWSATSQQMVGEVIAERSGVTLSEDFSAGIPVGWTVIDSSMNGTPDGFTWFEDDATDPSGCASANPLAPIAGTWMAVDSSCTGGGDRMDEQLISPVLDFSGDPVVTLEFDHWFDARTSEVAAVDVRSSATAGSWVTVAQWSGSSTTQHETIDISAQAADAPDVEIRWHYYDAQRELYWYVDNVVVHFFDPEECLNEVCAAPSSPPPPVPDGSNGSSAMQANRLTVDGSQISIAWDDQCAPASAKVIYGPLGQVATHTVTGSVCGIASPETWATVPGGDLWFVVVASDGTGVESSWGLASDGERNGLSSSNTCGDTVKEISGTCP